MATDLPCIKSNVTPPHPHPFAIHTLQMVGYKQIPPPRSALLAFGLVTSGQLCLGTLGTASRPSWLVWDRAPVSSFASAPSGHDTKSHTHCNGSDVLLAFGSSTLGQLGLQLGVQPSLIQTFIPSVSAHLLRIDALHAGMDHTLTLTSSPSSLGAPTIWMTGWSVDGPLRRPSIAPNGERDGFDSAWRAVDLSPLLVPSLSWNIPPAHQPNIISISVGADYTVVMHTSSSSVNSAAHPRLATWGKGLDH
ncbi:hypothetical protein M427DRAFT_36990 [Gonapodya prolifera JEL478]|uniref:Uncharacterized protein n=1 Tax=Gonapodya prolifera (strain JEL478) TaxID=1344416 RepID=A0A139A0Z8_GONPJ|nr:hypothetical protein M427DRAFT_36990 [Gonapodya prolifera JEL478]|eukprot:KXS10456.1 hypothetical protein M427DRAFT_36990 [Gonapodya prolifera JEL478]